MYNKEFQTLSPLCMKIDVLTCRLSTAWLLAPGRRLMLSTPPTISCGTWTQTQSMRSECCWPDQEREGRANLDRRLLPAPNVQVGQWLTGTEGDVHGTGFLITSIPNISPHFLLSLILWTSTVWPLELSDCQELIVALIAYWFVHMLLFFCLILCFYLRIGKVCRKEG